MNRLLHILPALLLGAAGLDASALPASGGADFQALRAQSVPQRIRITGYPTLGNQKALVILVAFEDCPFSTVDDAHAYFDGLLNEPGFTHENGADGSARDFYLASSDGRFDPEFVVKGPVTLPHPYKYYGEDANGWLDYRGSEMVADACRMLDGEVDFSQFDADGDGEVDNIYFFYAGYGQADTGEGNRLWPQSNDLYDKQKVDLTLDGVRINHYACSNEIRHVIGEDPAPAGIGTFVHEFTHVLGISDHYDSTFDGARPGVDNWDTMAAANYFNNMHTPPLLSAFERGELGWLEYEELTEDRIGETCSLAPLSDENRAYRVVVPGTEGNEYFILENRQQKGWDRFLPGHGLLVWHIDMDEKAWMNNKVNTDPEHNRVDIIEADGYESLNNLNGDPFPGRRKVTKFTFTGWDGAPVFSISDIVEDEAGNVSFTFGPEGSGMMETVSGIDEESKEYDITGRLVGKDYRGLVIVRTSGGGSRVIMKR